MAGLTPHELRHTAASLAIKPGANVKVVQQMLGHASAAITLDVYAGLFADNLHWTRWRTVLTRPSRTWLRTRCGLSAPTRS